VARRIQHASLPKEVTQLEGWQITPFYQPAREVGGASTTSTSSQVAALG
jgi:serine phosphatase RsbU (regulator of sigma subunit)